MIRQDDKEFLHKSIVATIVAKKGYLWHLSLKNDNESYKGLKESNELFQQWVSTIENNCCFTAISPNSEAKLL